MYDYSFVERVSIMLLFDEASESSSVRCRGGSSNHSFFLIFSTIFASACINLVRLSLHCLQHLLYALVMQ